MNIAKGTLVAISEGEYSGYRIIAAGNALEDLDLNALKEEWLKLHPEQAEDYHFEEYQFVKWLVVDKQLIEEVAITEWHIGSYSTIRKDFYLNEDNFAIRKED